LDQPELFDDLTFQAVASAALSDPAAKDRLDRSSQHADEALKQLAGQLSSPAARELAQEALENPELFDAIAAHGAMEQALQDPAARAAISAAGAKPARVAAFPRARWIAIGSIAAALVLVAAYLAKTRFSSQNIASNRPPSQDHAAPARGLTPGLDSASQGPVLLAQDLKARPATGGAVFRSSTGDSRAPRLNGSVVATDNLQVIVDLGSVDGLAKDTPLDVFHGDGKEPIARLTVTTVFRERARAGIVRGQGIREHDRVSAGPAVYLGAVIEQVDALAQSGDLARAREAARSAMNWAESSAAPAVRRRIVGRLAALDYQAGDIAAAESHYRSAVASFNVPPEAPYWERAKILNELAVIYLLRGDTTQAEELLRQAREQSRPGVVQGDILNNLGVLAELRGDSKKAQTFYQDALREFRRDSAVDPDSRTVETNLARLAVTVDEKH